QLGGGVVALCRNGSFPLLSLLQLLTERTHLAERAVAGVDGGVTGSFGFAACPFVLSHGCPGFLPDAFRLVGGVLRLTVCLVACCAVVAGGGQCFVASPFRLGGVSLRVFHGRVRGRYVFL